MNFSVSLIALALLLTASFASGQTERKSPVQTLDIEQIAPRQSPYYRRCIEFEEPPKVEWQRLELVPDSKGKSYLVRLRGKVPSGTRIFFRGDSIFVGTSVLRPIRLGLDQEAIETDPKGNFDVQVQLSLRDRLTAIPIELRKEEMKNGRPYVLRLIKVKAGVRAEMVPILTPTMRAQLCPVNRFLFGVGVTFFPYEQIGEEFDAVFTSVQAGSISADVRAWMNPRWGGQLTFKSAPGQLASAESSIPSQTFRWNVTQADVLYRPGRVFPFRGYYVDPYLQAGAQMHTYPLILSVSDVDLRFQEVGMTNVRLGLGAMVSTRNWLYEFYFGLQHPLSTTGIGVSSPVMFDGGVGLAYNKVGSRFQYGINWYGQWHQYRYQNPELASDQGNLKFIFSNLEGRIGISF